MKHAGTILAFGSLFVALMLAMLYSQTASMSGIARSVSSIQDSYRSVAAAHTTIAASSQRMTASWPSGGVVVGIEMTCAPAIDSSECRAQFKSELAAALADFNISER